MLEYGFKNFTGPAKIHFFFPGGIGIAVTERAIDEPAKIAGLEFPGRTLLFLLGRTCFSLPARRRALDIFF